MNQTYVLTLSCLDRPGIVAAVATALRNAGGNIRSAQQFDDAETGNFFMRVEFVAPDDSPSEVEQRIEAVASDYGMTWSLQPTSVHKKVILMVSKFDHCLGDLLYRWRIGELPMDVVGIIGNHPREALKLGLIDGIPYHHLPVTAATKSAQEAQIKQVVTESGADLIVLARYMQILSDDPAHGGWLLMMVDRVIADDYIAQEVWIFEADDITKGPISKVFMPFRTCEQIHGSWVPRRLLDQVRKD